MRIRQALEKIKKSKTGRPLRKKGTDYRDSKCIPSSPAAQHRKVDRDMKFIISNGKNILKADLV